VSVVTLFVLGLPQHAPSILLPIDVLIHSTGFLIYLRLASLLIPFFAYYSVAFAAFTLGLIVSPFIQLGC
jgi:hypothetical protein